MGSTMDVALTLRELSALHLLATSGENADPESIQAVTVKLEAALDAFRVSMGTRRWAAQLKNAWRRHDADAPTADEPTP